MWFAPRGKPDQIRRRQIALKQSDVEALSTPAFAFPIKDASDLHVTATFSSRESVSLRHVEDRVRNTLQANKITRAIFPTRGKVRVHAEDAESFQRAVEELTTKHGIVMQLWDERKLFHRILPLRVFAPRAPRSTATPTPDDAQLLYVPIRSRGFLDAIVDDLEERPSSTRFATAMPFEGYHLTFLTGTIPEAHDPGVQCRSWNGVPVYITCLTERAERWSDSYHYGR